jgi:hypothetical protein
MIDEAELTDLFEELANSIAVPDDAVDRVLRARPSMVSTTARRRAIPGQAVMIGSIAAGIVLLVGVFALIGGHTSGSGSKSSGSALSSPAIAPGTKTGVPSAGSTSAGAGAHTPQGVLTPVQPAPPTTIPTAPPPAGGGPSDAPKVVKTGALDLQLEHGTIRATVNRVTGIAVGLGGYVANSNTNFTNTYATAQSTIRLPVANFETAVVRLSTMPGATVLSSSTSGSDVTGQVTNLQAQLAAATAERDSLLLVLSDAHSIGDILSVRDRINDVQTEIDQLQGQLNLVNDQASYSSIAVSLTEKPLPTKPPHAASAPGGLAKAWNDGRAGFTNGVEWLIARSGGALIVLLSLLALVFGLRYLYPVVRRGLM